MKIAVVYKSKKNNKKLAMEIGKAINVVPQSLDEFDCNKDYDVVFFGAGIYGGSVAPDVLSKISSWNNAHIGKVILYSASGFGKNQYQSLIDTLRGNSIEVEQNIYICVGQAFFFKNHGRPNAQDCEAAGRFAQEMLKNL